MLSNTLVGRDKSMRFWQYLARMLSGLTGRELFARILYTMSVSRKTLRFWKPVKAAKAIDDVLRDSNLGKVEKVLTVSEVGNDGVYALVDHVCFAQRVGALPWLDPTQVDFLARFVEVVWLNETLSVICRELYTFLRSRSGAAPLAPTVDGGKSSARRRSAPPAPSGDGSSGEGSATPTRRRRTMSDRLLSPMVSYPSVASIGSLANDTKGDGSHAQSNRQDLPAKQVAKRQMSMLLLFKAAICDLPCCLYFLKPAEWRNRGRNKAWCGLLGMLSSLVAMHINWPSLLPTS
jgi:hypothetical protein